LSAAVAVGVATTFGAPIGGMLFAIEVTASQFTVNNLWKSFFASTIAVLCFKAFGATEKAALFSADASYFYQGDASLGVNQELPFHIILGIFCGVLGSIYISFQLFVNKTRKKLAANYSLFSNDWYYTLGMVFVCTNLIYFTGVMQTGDKGIINNMINID